MNVKLYKNRNCTVDTNCKLCNLWVNISAEGTVRTVQYEYCIVQGIVYSIVLLCTLHVCTCILTKIVVYYNLGFGFVQMTWGPKSSGVTYCTVLDCIHNTSACCVQRIAIFPSTVCTVQYVGICAG